MTARPAPRLADELAELPTVLNGCHAFLAKVHRSSDGLFPYSTRRSDWQSDYQHPQAIRYTINTLLGLQASARVGIGPHSAEDVSELTRLFLKMNHKRIVSVSDIGLLMLLLSDSEDADLLRDAVARATVLVNARRELSMQDLAWVVWGASAAHRAGLSGAGGLAHSSFTKITEDYVDKNSCLPRHSARWYRRHVVSFGSLVYYLRAAHEHWQLSGDSKTRVLFERGVERALGLQGPRGEWPWMIDVGSGRVTDFYPVFGVHQDSMAHLFLLPALDSGIVEARDAIVRSWNWILGENELHQTMFDREPFFAYRSIERAEALPRARRYIRATFPGASDPTPPGSGAGIRINPECRSYHLGWILYVWSGRLGRELEVRHAD